MSRPAAASPRSAKLPAPLDRAIERTGELASRGDPLAHAADQGREFQHVSETLPKPSGPDNVEKPDLIVDNGNVPATSYGFTPTVSGPGGILWARKRYLDMVGFTGSIPVALPANGVSRRKATKLP
jgi:hypothetical protein